MRLRSALLPLLLLFAVQQGPFRFQITHPAITTANGRVQMQAHYGSFRGLGQAGGGQDLTGVTSWSGSDSTVARVDNTGLVTPTGNGGTVTISGTSGRFSYFSNLVFPPFTCSGENYDVNNNIADGCEVKDLITGNHTQGTAVVIPQTTCDDVGSQNTFTGYMPSDSRVHTMPVVSGFDSTTGAAPDWYSVFDTGGVFCVDDYALTFTTTGGGSTPCYQATITTNKITNSVTVNGHGSGSISGGANSYTDNTTVYFTIQKVCTLPVQENVTYTVSYHL